MSILFMLIPIALLLALSFLLAFYWAQKNGQFTDTDSPSVRILIEPKNDKNHNKN